MRAILIDGGGTSTDVALAADGECVARTRLPSVKPTVHDQRTDELCRMLGSFLVGTGVTQDDDVATQLDAIIVGMAGVWTPYEHHRYRRAFRDSWEMYVESKVPELIVMSDAELVAYAAYGKGPGLVLIAGTGSIALLRDEAGVLKRCGGWGPRIEDAGGGFWLGRKACIAVARMLDSRGPETLLVRPVASYVRADAEDQESIMVALRSASLDGVSRIGHAVLAYAEEGDAVAMQIREQGALALGELVATLHKSGNYAITAYGSLWSNSEYASLIALKCGQPISVLHDLLLALARTIVH